MDWPQAFIPTHLAGHDAIRKKRRAATRSLVFSGLATGDFSILVLRNYISRRGHACLAKDQGLRPGLRPMFWNAAWSEFGCC
jgi:hypothetical protein